MTYPCVYHCFLASHKHVIPFFARSQVLRDGIDDQPEHIAELLRMPIDEFAELVFSDRLADAAGENADDVLDLFQRDHDCLGCIESERLSCDPDFEGIFIVEPTLVSDDAWLVSVDPEHYDRYVQAKFDDETVFTVPLLRQPELFVQPYGSAEEIIAEVKSAIKEMDVEMPEDFPYWRFIGKLEGTVYAD